MYKIFVNSKEAALEKIRVSAHPFNRVWPGKQRDIAQSETAYMLRLFGDRPLTVEIVCKSTPQRVVIRPLSRAIVPAVDKNRISLVLPSNGKFSVEIDGVHGAIHLFYQKPVIPAAYGEATYHFASGHHRVGLLTLKSGESVYIAPDAVVHGSLYAVDADGIKIFGGGVLCGDWETRTERHGDIGFDGETYFSPELVHTYGGIRMYRCKNVTVEGITVTDTASYGMSFFATDGIRIDDVNVVGLWKYNCDGIDFFNSQNITVTDTFIRSFDDSMCMKGLTAFSYMNTENAHISRAVFWCDWGKNIDIGLATACREIKNITWEDCDIIHNSHSCITISNGQWADVHDIVYRNIRVEYSSDTEKPMLQINDADSYVRADAVHVPTLIDINDTRRAWQGNISYDDERTKIRNITIDGIYVSTDGLIPEPAVIVKKVTESSCFENIVIDNITVDSCRMSPAHGN